MLKLFWDLIFIFWDLIFIFRDVILIFGDVILIFWDVILIFWDLILSCWFKDKLFLKALTSFCKRQSSSLQHNIPRSFCLILVFWNVSTPYTFLFVTSSFLTKKSNSSFVGGINLSRRTLSSTYAVQQSISHKYKNAEFYVRDY